MKKRAFTMVELIFVIVILGILAAVAVPKLNASREDAKIAANIANLRILMNDLRTFHAAQSGFGSAAEAQVSGELKGPSYDICEDAGGEMTWDGCVLTPYDISQMSSVNLSKGTETIEGAIRGSVDVKNFIMHLTNDDNCLKFRIFDANTLRVTPSEQAGTNSLCARFLGKAAVQNILTGTDDLDGTNPKIVGAADTKPVYFNFAASSVNFD